MAKKAPKKKATRAAAAELVAVREESAALRRLADAQERQRALLRRVRRNATAVEVLHATTARALIDNDREVGVFHRDVVEGYEARIEKLTARVAELARALEQERNAPAPASA